METNDTLNINKRYLWADIVKACPNRWVAISDYEYSGGDLISCILRAVCTEQTMLENGRLLKEKGRRIKWKRTTPLFGSNILWQD